MSPPDKPVLTGIQFLPCSLILAYEDYADNFFRNERATLKTKFLIRNATVAFAVNTP